MLTSLGWRVLNEDAGFSISHVACGDTTRLNLATVVALQGMGTDPYVDGYRAFLEYHNNWMCRDDLECLRPLAKDEDSALPSTD